jgi:hypothetical protein
MSWLSKSDLEEWLQDPLAQRLREVLERKRQEGLSRLRQMARLADLPKVVEAEARVSTLDEVLTYFKESE